MNKKDDDYLKFGNEKQVIITMALLIAVSILGYITNSELVDIIGFIIVLAGSIFYDLL